jgi:hypothetical protein
MRRDMSRKDQPQEKGKSGRTELRRSTPVLLSSEEMSASRQGGEDPDAQQPHEQPHEAAEVELVDDDDKEVQADFQAQERAAKEKQDRLKKGLGPKGNLGLGLGMGGTMGRFCCLMQTWNSCTDQRECSVS